MELPDASIWIAIILAVLLILNKRYHTAAERKNSVRTNSLMQELEQKRRENDELSARQKSASVLLDTEIRSQLEYIETVASDARLPAGDKLSLISKTAASMNSAMTQLSGVVAPWKVKSANAARAVLSSELKRVLSQMSAILKNNDVKLHLVDDSEMQECLFNLPAFDQLVTSLVKHVTFNSNARNIWISLTASENSERRVKTTLLIEDDGEVASSLNGRTVHEAYIEDGGITQTHARALLMSREAIAALNGKADLKPSKQGGSAFILELSLAIPEPQQEISATSAESSSASPLQGKVILLVEDDQVVQLVTDRRLTKAGAWVVVCNNGEEALEAYDGGVFDIVLTDLLMPKVDGYQLTKQLRDKGFSGPIICATAVLNEGEGENEWISSQLTEGVLAAGADAILPKPTSLEAIVTALTTIEMSGFRSKQVSKAS